ncbi:MAG: iron-containing alcohol dehydrogenase [Verrucomicrobiales bacterium]|nr:iron-containing alcohol dehydrogenase [Verrucomicrobiales bacterium]MCP5558157.1 iron-containing alcohol dehydrogenase [Verrucomicrobiaceae bacterium]
MTHSEGLPERHGYQFDYSSPARILFGCGRSAEAATVCYALGQRILIVTGSRQRQSAAIASALAELGATTATFSLSKEPTIEDVEEGLAMAKAIQASVVLSIGGGAAIDLGKAIAAMIPQPEPLITYLEVIGAGRPLDHPSAPFIAIPTTAGTGAEATKNAVITSVTHRTKVSLRHTSMFPTIAIIDPELSLTLPPDVTAACGMDALTQLMEAYVTLKAQPMTDALCASAIPIAARALPTAYHNGGDIAAREAMAYAALSSGIALANAGLGAVHGFAAPIGGLCHAPHGAVCAALLAPVWAMNLRLVASSENAEILQRFVLVAQWLTNDPHAQAKDGVRWLQELSRELQIPKLRSLGVKAEDLPQISANAAKASSMKGNPVALSEAQRIEILEEAL